MLRGHLLRVSRKTYSENYVCDKQQRIITRKQQNKQFSQLIQTYARLNQAEQSSYCSPLQHRMCIVQCSANQQENQTTTTKQLQELVDKTIAQNEVSYSQFLLPPQQKELQLMCTEKGLESVAWGGVENCERCRVAIGKSENIGALLENPAAMNGAQIIQMRVKGQFLLDPAYESDYREVSQSVGASPDAIGDIRIKNPERGCTFYATPEAATILEEKLVKILTVTCRTIRDDQQQANPPEPQQVQTRELKSVERSLRLDALGSAGFRFSRSKMGKCVKDGKVTVNYKPAVKPAQVCAQGDVIAVSKPSADALELEVGRGRVEVVEVKKNRSGKFAVSYKRYL